MNADKLPKVQNMGKQLTLKYSAFHLLLAISRSVKKSRLAVFHGCCVLQW
ncbi:BnaA01g07710D [Brassica napus]|uniref:BnaA01g07710D protein n=1 Tax=Brassica napus TaxID=3708 RepID=A0A078H9X6_BRANA|nr:BnaA01g07710D [Brassica napus]